MNVLALIPARIGSKGIPHKNFRLIAPGVTPLGLAIRAAAAAGVDDIVVSTDHEHASQEEPRESTHVPGLRWRFLYAPAPLHTDTCPMIDVVTDALARVPGPSDQVVVLLQPTQPLRTPAHVQAAITLLRESQADSVVSVTDIGLRDELLYVGDRGVLELVVEYHAYWRPSAGGLRFPACRQGQPRAFKRDGTVYAFYRQTVEQVGNIYGRDVRPLIIPSEETCSLDTPADWIAAERRLRESTS
jgi:CMP-N,N'-diacetyllegionaminic acid synthase